MQDLNPLKISIRMPRFGSTLRGAQFLLLATFFLLLTPTSASALGTSKNVVTNGLVGYWTFDNLDTNWTSATTGTTKDKSVNGNTGTLTNMSRSTSPVAGKIGTALKFDGGDDYVTISSSAALNIGTTATYSTWVKINALPPNSFGYSLVRKWSNGSEDKSLSIAQDGKPNLFFYNVGAGVSANTILSTGVWHFIVGTYDGAFERIYIDGVLDNSSGASGDVADNVGAALTLGHTPENSAYLNGSLDEVRIYNRAISPVEVKTLYNQGLAKFGVSPTKTQTNGVGISSGLVGHWTFDGKNMTNATATDSSGNNNNGTLTNMTVTSSKVIGKLGQALRFDGMNDYVTIPDSAPLRLVGTNFTMSAWIKPNSLHNYGGVLSKFEATPTGGYGILTFADGSWSYQNKVLNVSDVTNPAGTLVNGVWAHITATLVGSTLTTYTNGVQTGQDTINAVLSNSEPLRIGLELSGAGSRYFDGVIDEVRIYNRALSASEVRGLYNTGKVKIVATPSFTCGVSTVKDADNNVYNTLTIGTQCWMKQNMRVGTRIAASSNQTNNSTIEKYCYSNSDANCTSNNPNQPDGGLYQWDEAMQYVTTAGARGICPAGWHIPTDGEQYTLENYLKDNGQTCNASRIGSYDCDTAGTKLKPNGSSGFEGNLAGSASAGSFGSRGSIGIFWSSSESGANAFYRFLNSANSKVYRNASTKSNGLSVRCLKN